VTEVHPRFKAPKAPKAKGRARPTEPLADWCEAVTPACTGRPTVRHHRRLRKQGGTDDPANTLDVCSPGCHEYIHANPAESYARGWLLRRTA
jgi:hypothetical protein